MTMVRCEDVAVGDRVRLARDHEPITVTTTETNGDLVYLFEGTATVLSLIRGTEVERL